jgi:hypothetical protein
MAEFSGWRVVAIAVPSGTSIQRLAQAEQSVTGDQQMLSSDEQAESDASAADDQAISDARSTVDTAQATLVSDEVQESEACSSSAPSQVCIRRCGPLASRRPRRCAPCERSGRPVRSH